MRLEFVRFAHPTRQTLCFYLNRGVRHLNLSGNPVSAKLMGKYDKLLVKILKGTSDANIAFEDLCELLRRLGFEERIRGSHHVFRKEGVEEKINLQRDNSTAKLYQVRQVRAVIVKYKLVDE